MEAQQGGLWGFLASVGRGIDLARRLVVNFLFLVILGLALVLFQQPKPILPDQAALVLRPQGNIVEQLSGDPVSRAIAALRDLDTPETLLQDLLAAVRAAKDDPRIKVLFLDLNSMGGAGLNKLQELRAAIDDFKTSNKPVIAAADFYVRSNYYLATTADEVYLHEQGLVLLEGYGIFQNYFKQGIDRLEIDWNVFRAGEYKSAVEPFLREDMSPEDREATRDWLGDLWQSYVEDVAASRNLTPAAFNQGLERFTTHLAGAQGKAAEAAKRLGLVDHVGSRDAVKARLIELVGEDENEHTFRQVDFRDYLVALGHDRPGFDRGGQAVGILVASGNIIDGHHAPGTVGGESTAELIRKARHDDNVKALLLRVDSGGGSMFASEVIRRELELFRAAEKPLVVSMSSLAASGGYYIATPADEIWASPTTITGSIGVYGMFPTFQKPLERHLGIKVDGVGTNWLSGSLRLDRALDPRVKDTLQLMLESSYQDFLRLVGEARKMSPEEANQVARGRPWSGVDAARLNLVDHLGNLTDAVKSAAARAELGDDFDVRYLEPELDFGDRLLLSLLTKVKATRVTLGFRPGVHASPLATVERLLQEKQRLEGLLHDPLGLYAHCRCEVEW